VLKRESKTSYDDRLEKVRFVGVCREKISQAIEGVNHRWHTGNPSRDAAVQHGF
jgi:hypothetical protein